jgi:mycofactocin precursor peptide MftA
MMAFRGPGARLLVAPGVTNVPGSPRRTAPLEARMPEPTTTLAPDTAPDTTLAGALEAPAVEEELVEESLVEEVSIDGMCGVY